ncbi:MAG: outer membrane protein transport protein, partial [Bacteroidota bacterium]
MKKTITLFLVSVMLASSAYAGGFQINEHGARAMAMGGAFTGLANDPSAIYFNPAGIAQLKGTQFYAGATMILPISSFALPKPSTTEYEMKSQVFSPINFYVTQQLSEKFYAGISVNNQYGLGTKWDPNWIGRYLAVETEVRTFFITPVVAYKFSDNFSLSVGATYAFADVKIARKSPNPNPTQSEPLIDMNGTATAFGFTAGLLYKPSSKFQLGLSYRSESKFDFSGTVVSNPATFTHPLLKVNLPFPYGDIKAPLTTPQNITFGLAYIPDDRWTATFDFQYIGWSSYNKLEVTFSSYDLDLNPANGVQNVQSVVRDYQNTFIVRGGLEYKASDSFAL